MNAFARYLSPTLSLTSPPLPLAPTYVPSPDLLSLRLDLIRLGTIFDGASSDFECGAFPFDDDAFRLRRPEETLRHFHLSAGVGRGGEEGEEEEEQQQQKKGYVGRVLVARE